MLFHTISIEFLGDVPLYIGLGIQTLTALFLGGMVGYDREKKLKAAGLKTNILICLGATLYTTIGIIVSQNASGVSDPTRMAAQIVSGIGFLGAGAIIQGRGNVIGLTTAATIWVVAAIGFAIGAGYPFSALFFSITVLMVLKLINPVYNFLEREQDRKEFHLEVLSFGSVKRTVSGIVFGESLQIHEIYEEEWTRDPRKVVLNIFIDAHPRQMDRLASEIKTAIKVEKVSYHQVDSHKKLSAIG